MSFEVLLPVVISFLSAFAAALTAWVTHRLYNATMELRHVTEQMADISRESTRSAADALILNAVNAQNILVLASVENMRTADSLIKHDELEKTDEAIRERWIAFTLLNVQQLLYFEAKAGRFSTTYQEVSANQVLDRILANEHIHILLRDRGYSHEFVQYCEERIEKCAQGQQVNKLDRK